jgi:hypothetical protein
LSAAERRFFTRKMTTDFRLAATKTLRREVPPAEGCQVALVIRRITIAVLAAFLVGAVLAVPATSASGRQAVAAKKAKKCKKKKKGKKKKGCKKSSTNSLGIPGQSTPDKPTAPTQPEAPPTLHVSSVDVAPSTVLAPNSTTGTVTVDVAAPTGGQRVDLQSNSARVSVPSSVVVAAGQKNASFSVGTTTGPPVTATISASIGTSSASTQLKVVDTASVDSVKLERQCFTFGPFSSNRVSLDVPAPDDTLVALSSDDAALTVPSGVTVPSGSSSAFFSVNAVSDAPSVTVTATLGSSQASDTASVSSAPPANHADGLTLNPDTVIAGNGSTGTVTLDCEAPAAGTVVTLTSAAPGVTFTSTGTQSATVTVLDGQLSANFQIDTDPGLADDQYDISATVGADTPVHATLTIDSSLPT